MGKPESSASRKAEAAHRIAAARLARRPFPGLPDELKPRDQMETYDVQDLVFEQLVGAGFGPAVGFKLGCTAPVMQRELNIHYPCSGRMYQSGILKDGGKLDPKRYVRPGVECEIAVTLAKPFLAKTAPISRDAVWDAVGSVHAAIELVDERYDDWRAVGAETLIADDFFHAGILLGPAVTAWRDLDLENLPGTARVNGKVIGEGCSADTMGHPFAALEWFANHRTQRGEDVPAGTIISLGSVTAAYWLEPGDTVEMGFENLGPNLRLTYL